MSGSDFLTRLAARIRGGAAPAVVGLDPRPDALPGSLLPGAPAAERILAFYREVLPVLGPAGIPCVKPNVAFFEAWGSSGYAAYEETCWLARGAGLLVIGDVKRGDIGPTAEAYAAGHFRLADALTLHPYLGRDSLDPFLWHCRRNGGPGKAVFVLVRTSNPGASDFQDLDCGGRSLSRVVAEAVRTWNEDFEPVEGYGPVGAVVGATWPEELLGLRRAMPRSWILIPGVGAQGGKVEDLSAAFDARGFGALVNQSRGILQCFEPGSAEWLDEIREAARGFARACRRAAGLGGTP
ncbi:MAG: orotidine-5'-phosphate decarboxylase [Planctomycetota bacterium]